MPIQFDVGPGDRRCTVHMHGVIALADLKAAVTAVAAANAWGRKTVYDTTASTGILIHWQDIEALVTFVEAMGRGRGPRGATVIIASSDVIYGCARMYQEAVDGRAGHEVFVARSVDEAEAWLAER